MALLDYLKNIFFILLFLQFAPALIDGVRKQYLAFFETRTKVAVINVHDTVCSSNGYVKQLHTFFKAPDVKAILLYIECSAGAAGSAQAIYNEIQILKKAHPKPIIALVENVAASGGYYVACATDYIIAPSAALIGSIGVYMPYFFKVKELMEQYKIKYPLIKAGKYKAITDPFVELTADDAAHLQLSTQDTYEQFVADVARSRKLSVNAHTQWADGKVFTGRQAKALGLIDEEGSKSNAIKALREKALIEGEIEWIQPQGPSKLATWLGSSSQDDSFEDEGSMNEFKAFTHHIYGLFTLHTKGAGKMF